MSNIVIDIAAEFTGKKAFHQADTATQKLTKSTKSLGRALGVAFSTAAVIGFAKKSIKASIEAQAQQQRLAKLLKITVGATDSQIQALNSQAKALEQIGVVSAGNITQTQSQLATFNLQLSTIEALTPAILDYVTAEKGASASTEQFKSMTNGLAQALNGNFTSLTRVGFVIDENTKLIIKNGTESERTAAIIKVLDSTYKGFNNSLRDTPSGQMALLANAAQAAATVIGTSLLGALQSLGKDDSMATLGHNIESAAKSLANLIDSIVYLKGQIASIPGAGILGYLASGVTDLLGRFSPQRLAELIKQIKGFQGMGNIAMTGGSNMDTQKFEARQKKLFAAKEKADKKSATLKIALDKKAAANKAKLDKAAQTLDLTRIGIAAALKGKISEEEKIRLQLMMAIEDENGVKAEKLANKLEEIQAKNAEIAKSLTDIQAAKDPFSAWVSSLTAAAGLLGAMPSLITASGALTPRGKVTIAPEPTNPIPVIVVTPQGGGSVFTPAPTFTSSEIIPQILNIVENAAVAAASEVATIFTGSETIPEILTIVENAAAAASEAAIAAADSVSQTQTIVDALAVAATNGTPVTGTSSMFNPYATTPSSSSGTGIQNPVSITINNNGSVIMQDEFTQAVNDAVIAANTNGLNNYRPGALAAEYL